MLSDCNLKGSTDIIAEHNLDLFVKDVLVLKSQKHQTTEKLSFFADGYPGIVYLRSEQGLLLPRQKALTSFFLYGQMIAPFELGIQAPYVLIVFQLYPFATRLLFEVDPKSLINDCYDLSRLYFMESENPLKKLNKTSDPELQIKSLASFLSKITLKNGIETYQEIQRATQTVLDHKGKISIGELAEFMNMTERTLRRRFLRYVGISPKKFARIIQFQTSLEQISTGDFSKMSDVVYENGYADQSHFIRNVKKFTGKRPLELRRPL